MITLERTRNTAQHELRRRQLRPLELQGVPRDARPGPMEIMVFGSNWNPATQRGGFHGAGSAALAMRGIWNPDWREDPAFLAEQEAFKQRRAPRNGPHYARFGVGLGLQRGRQGLSYAVATVTRPGARLSYPLSEAERLDDQRRGLRPDTHTLSIETQLRTLIGHMRAQAQYTFLCLPLGEGYAGLGRAEMNLAWALALDGQDMPENFVFVPRHEPT